MQQQRRARPTIRCVTNDLEVDLPGLAVDLGDLDHPFMDELRRVAPTSPEGQKRILSIDHPLVYRIRVSSERGATWVDEERGIVWLCAAHRRQQDSDNDAYAYFADLHASGDLLPDDDDRLRDRAEGAIRLQRGLAADLIQLLDMALAARGTEHRADLGDWLPCRILAIPGDGVEEIWCALCIRGTDGTFVPESLRDVLFAALEQHVRARHVRGKERLANGRRRVVRGCRPRLALAAPTSAGYSRNCVGRLAEQVSSDGNVTTGKDFACSVESLGDHVSVSRGVLVDGTIDDLGLGRIGERSKVADALLGDLVDLDGCLGAHGRLLDALSVEVPKYLVNPKYRRASRGLEHPR
jgi:hypothetical protein